MSGAGSEKPEDTLRIALINVCSTLKIERYVEWAAKSGVDVLVLSESPGKAHRGKVDCAAYESDQSMVAVYKINKGLEWATPFANEYHVVVRIRKPRITIHAWYLPHRLSTHPMRDEAFEAACWELALKKEKTLHIGDMNSVKSKGRGIQLNQAATTGRFSHLNVDETPTFTNRGNGSIAANDWALISEDLEMKARMELRPETHGSDHDLMIVEVGEGVVPSAVTKGPRRIKPSVFLREVGKLIDEKGIDQWHDCKEEAAERARAAYAAKSEVQSPEMRRLTEEVEKLSRKIGAAKGMLDHLKPELRHMINLKEKKRSEEKLSQLNEKMASVTSGNVWKNVKTPKGLRKANFVQAKSEQLRGAEAGEAILAKCYPLRERPPLKMPKSAPPDVTPITEVEVEEAARKMKPNAAPGKDGLSWKLVKQWQKRSNGIFVTLFSQWYREAIFPDELKEAMVVPLLKSPSTPSEIKNIRPVSLLDTIGKWYEKVLDLRMMHHLESLKLISDDQYAYREKKGAEKALSVLFKAHRESLTKRRCEVMLQVDVKGAFDNLNHQAIIDEASKHGLPGNIVRILMSYLTGRRATVELDGEKVSREILQGAAQGSVLGPHLFLLATNRALRVATVRARAIQGTEVNVVAFADDVIVTAGAENDDRALEVVKCFAENLTEQLKEVGLEVAPEKTNVMFINWTPIIREVEILGARITTVKQTKILGVMYTHNLDTAKHLQMVGAKIEAKSATLKATMGHSLRTEHRKTVSMATLAPMITYGAQAWFDPTTRANERDRKMKEISKTVARTITDGPRFASAAAHHVMADIMPLKYTCEQKAKIEADLDRGRCPLTGKPIEKKLKLADLPRPYEWKRRELEASITKEEDMSVVAAKWIYSTDGSKYEGDDDSMLVGAAYVRSNYGEKETKMLKLHDRATVYQAEVLAIKAALADAIQLQHPTTVAIVSDSESALTAICQPRPDDVEIRECQRALDLLERRGTKVALHWVKAHAGVMLNEEADEAAKRAAKDGRPTDVPVPVSALKRAYREQAKREYDAEYLKDKAGKEIKKYAPKPGERPRAMNIEWRTAQVYSGHGLNRTSNRFGFTGSGQKCPCGAEQSMSHVITTCPVFIEQNVKYALAAGMSLQDFLAPWQELRENAKFYRYIDQRSGSLARELRQCNLNIIEEEEIKSALRKAFSKETVID